MTNGDVNVVMAFLLVSLALAALAVLVDPKLSRWVGRRLWAHSIAQRQARKVYRETVERVAGTAVLSEESADAE